MKCALTTVAVKVSGDTDVETLRSGMSNMLCAFKKGQSLAYLYSRLGTGSLSMLAGIP